ncbi:hypothetical protein BDP27DRAFT_1426624 [Rhodocollybia butyracea]|uniref:F-box domain-containing protein n=1 Tax=Rhodocollybia butyracea TaxID=206335 RepID=A0A9P5U2Q6_9AGAR|nr:hypothetical protein BDP27DRAFT_1426624 [Rhodocollybia butyracea]
MTTSLCARCAQKTQIRVNLSPAEISKIHNDLRSEFGPSVTPPERVKEMLALADKDIEDHDSEIARLHDQIMIIEEQKQQLEAQRAELRALLSPMRKLPNEILFRIFQQACETNCLDDERMERYNPFRRSWFMITHLPAMAISYVCSRWRDLALSSPEMWANLTMRVGHTITRDVARNLRFRNMVTRFLERSGEWPLTLSLDINPQNYALPEMAEVEMGEMGIRVLGYATQDNARDLESVQQLSHLVEHAPRLRTLATGKAPLSNASLNQLDGLHFLVVELKDNVVYDSVMQGTWHNITSLAIVDRSLPPDGTSSVDGSSTVDDSFTPSSNMIFSSFRFPSLNELVVKGNA